MIGSFRRHILCKIMALTVCFTFIWQSIGPAAEAESVYKASLSSGSHGMDIASIKVPVSFGEVIDSSKGSIDKTVIHIRDAHCDYSAQGSISGLIGYFRDTYGVDLVALEGGSGDYDLSVFTDIKDGELREKVADYFVQQGEVNGAEFYAINNPAKVTLYGIEEPALYVENLSTYRDSLKFKDKAVTILKSIAEDVSKQKDRIYPSDFRELDKKMRLFKEDKIGFEEYAAAIAAYAKKNNIDMSEYPNISRFYEAVDSENGVNMKEAERERNILIDLLNKRLSKKYLEELVAKTVAFNDNEISASEYYPYLLAKAELCGIELDKMPNLIKYTHTAKKISNVNKKALEREFKALEERICSSFLKTDEQRALCVLDKKVFILDRLFSAGLVKDDWDYYIAHRNEFDTKEFASLNGYRLDMEKFYDLSLKRDDFFINNIVGKLKKEEQKNIILVTGGFHQDNLKKLFQDKGYSYVEVLPKIEKGEGKNPYFGLLSGGADPITKAMMEKHSNLQIASFLSKLGGEVYGKDEVSAFNNAVTVVTGLISEERAATIGDLRFSFKQPEGVDYDARITDLDGQPVYVFGLTEKQKTQLAAPQKPDSKAAPAPAAPAAPALAAPAAGSAAKNATGASTVTSAVSPESISGLFNQDYLIPEILGRFCATIKEPKLYRGDSLGSVIRALMQQAGYLSALNMNGIRLSPSKGVAERFGDVVLEFDINELLKRQPGEFFLVLNMDECQINGPPIDLSALTQKSKDSIMGLAKERGLIKDIASRLSISEKEVEDSIRARLTRPSTVNTQAALQCFRELVKRLSLKDARWLRDALNLNTNDTLESLLVKIQKLAKGHQIPISERIVGIAGMGFAELRKELDAQLPQAAPAPAAPEAQPPATTGFGQSKGAIPLFKYAFGKLTGLTGQKLNTEYYYKWGPWIEEFLFTAVTLAVALLLNAPNAVLILSSIIFIVLHLFKYEGGVLKAIIITAIANLFQRFISYPMLQIAPLEVQIIGILMIYIAQSISHLKVNQWGDETIPKGSYLRKVIFNFSSLVAVLCLMIGFAVVNPATKTAPTAWAATRPVTSLVATPAAKPTLVPGPGMVAPQAAPAAPEGGGSWFRNEGWMRNAWVTETVISFGLGVLVYGLLTLLGLHDYASLAGLALAPPAIFALGHVFNPAYDRNIVTKLTIAKLAIGGIVVALGLWNIWFAPAAIVLAIPLAFYHKGLNLPVRVYERTDTTRRIAVNRVVDAIKSHKKLKDNVAIIAQKIREGKALNVNDKNVLEAIRQRLEHRNSLVTLSRKVHTGDRVVTFSQQNIKLLNSTLSASQTDEVIERRHRVLKLLLRRARLIGPKNEGILLLSYKQDKFVIKEDVLKRLELEGIDITERLNKVSETLAAIMNKYIIEKSVKLENAFGAYYGLSETVSASTDEARILADIQALQASKLARRSSDEGQAVYGAVFKQEDFDSLINIAQDIKKTLGLKQGEMPPIKEMESVRGRPEKGLEDREKNIKKYLDIIDLFDYPKDWSAKPDVREIDKNRISRLLEILENVGARAPPDEIAAKTIEEALTLLETNTKNSKITSGNAFHYYALKRSKETRGRGRIVSADAIGFWANIQKNLAQACENYVAGKSIVDESLAADDKVKEMMKQNIDELVRMLGNNVIMESGKIVMYQEGGDEIAFFVPENFDLAGLVNDRIDVRLMAAEINYGDPERPEDIEFALGYTEVTHASYGDAYMSSQAFDNKAKDLEKLGIRAVVSEEIDTQDAQGKPEIVAYHKKGDSVVRESYEEAVKSAPAAPAVTATEATTAPSAVAALSSLYHQNRSNVDLSLSESRFGVSGANIVNVLITALKEELHITNPAEAPIVSVIGSLSYALTDTGNIDWDAVNDFDLRIHTNGALSNDIQQRIIIRFYKILKERFGINVQTLGIDERDAFVKSMFMQQWSISELSGNKKYRTQILFADERDLFKGETGFKSYRPTDLFFGNIERLNIVLNKVGLDIMIARTALFYNNMLKDAKEEINDKNFPNKFKIKVLKNLYQLAYLRGETPTWLLTAYKKLNENYDEDVFIKSCERALKDLEIEEGELRKELSNTMQLYTTQPALPPPATPAAPADQAPDMAMAQIPHEERNLLLSPLIQKGRVLRIREGKVFVEVYQDVEAGPIDKVASSLPPETSGRLDQVIQRLRDIRGPPGKLEKAVDELISDLEKSGNLEEFILETLLTKAGIREQLLLIARKADLLIVKDSLVLHREGPFAHARRGSYKAEDPGSLKNSAIWLGQYLFSQNISDSDIARLLAEEAQHILAPRLTHNEIVHSARLKVVLDKAAEELRKQDIRYKDQIPGILMCETDMVSEEDVFGWIQQTHGVRTRTVVEGLGRDGERVRDTLRQVTERVEHNDGGLRNLIIIALNRALGFLLDLIIHFAHVTGIMNTIRRLTLVGGDIRDRIQNFLGVARELIHARALERRGYFILAFNPVDELGEMDLVIQHTETGRIYIVEIQSGAQLPNRDDARITTWMIRQIDEKGPGRALENIRVAGNILPALGDALVSDRVFTCDRPSGFASKEDARREIEDAIVEHFGKKVADFIRVEVIDEQTEAELRQALGQLQTEVVAEQERRIGELGRNADGQFDDNVAANLGRMLRHLRNIAGLEVPYELLYTLFDRFGFDATARENILNFIRFVRGERLQQIIAELMAENSRPERHRITADFVQGVELERNILRMKADFAKKEVPKLPSEPPRAPGLSKPLSPDMAKKKLPPPAAPATPASAINEGQRSATAGKPAAPAEAETVLLKDRHVAETPPSLPPLPRFNTAEEALKYLEESQPYYILSWSYDYAKDMLGQLKNTQDLETREVNYGAMERLSASSTWRTAVYRYKGGIIKMIDGSIKNSAKSYQLQLLAMREAAILRELGKSPELKGKIPEVYGEFFDQDGNFGFEMKDVGPSLASVINSNYAKKPDANDFESLAIGMFELLRDLHEAGIWHLDLKHTNITIPVSDDGSFDFRHPKLIDFGLAIKTDKDFIKFQRVQDLIGSPGYIPNETEEDYIYSRRNDFYGLGKVLGYCESATKGSNPELIELKERLSIKRVDIGSGSEDEKVYYAGLEDAFRRLSEKHANQVQPALVTIPTTTAIAIPLSEPSPTLVAVPAAPATTAKKAVKPIPGPDLGMVALQAAPATPPAHVAIPISEYMPGSEVPQMLKKVQDEFPKAYEKYIEACSSLNRRDIASAKRIISDFMSASLNSKLRKSVGIDAKTAKYLNKIYLKIAGAEFGFDIRDFERAKDMKGFFNSLNENDAAQYFAWMINILEREIANRSEEARYGDDEKAVIFSSGRHVDNAVECLRRGGISEGETLKGIWISFVRGRWAKYTGRYPVSFGFRKNAITGNRMGLYGGELLVTRGENGYLDPTKRVKFLSVDGLAEIVFESEKIRDEFMDRLKSEEISIPKAVTLSIAPRKTALTDEQLTTMLKAVMSPSQAATAAPAAKPPQTQLAEPVVVHRLDTGQTETITGPALIEASSGPCYVVIIHNKNKGRTYAAHSTAFIEGMIDPDVEGQIDIATSERGEDDNITVVVSGTQVISEDEKDTAEAVLALRKKIVDYLKEKGYTNIRTEFPDHIDTGTNIYFDTAKGTYTVEPIIEGAGKGKGITIEDYIKPPAISPYITKAGKILTVAKKEVACNLTGPEVSYAQRKETILSTGQERKELTALLFGNLCDGKPIEINVFGATPTDKNANSHSVLETSSDLTRQMVQARRYANEESIIGKGNISISHTIGVEAAKKKIEDMLSQEVTKERSFTAISASVLDKLEKDDKLKGKFGKGVKEFLEERTMLSIMEDAKGNDIYLMPYLEATILGLARINLVDQLAKSNTLESQGAKDAISAYARAMKLIVNLQNIDFETELRDAAGQDPFSFFKDYIFRMKLPPCMPADLNELQSVINAMTEAWRSL